MDEQPDLATVTVPREMVEKVIRDARALLNERQEVPGWLFLSISDLSQAAGLGTLRERLSR